MNTLAYSTTTGGDTRTNRGYDPAYTLTGIRPTRSIRRPRVARFEPRLTCTPEELAAADRKR